MMKHLLWTPPAWQRERYHWIFSLLRHQIHPPDVDFPSLYIQFYQTIVHGHTRRDYRRFLSFLRHLLPHAQGKAGDWLTEICFTLFTLDFEPYCQKVLSHFKKDEEERDLSRFPHTYQEIANAPRKLKQSYWREWFEFLHGQSNLAFDPYLQQENTPYLLFQREKTRVLRLGTPTREGFFSPFTQYVTLNPEFIGFLKALEKRQWRHLYINLQRRDPYKPWYNERPRSLAIESLAAAFPHCAVVSLPKNTPFYQQLTPEELPFDTFFLQFLHELASGHFFFSLPFPEQEQRTILHQVHQRFFAKKETLTTQERKDFIELAYLLIIEWFQAKFQPHTMNISCKDGIDRAGMTNALFYLHWQLTTGQFTPDQWKKLEAILFAPALLVKKRPLRRDRFDRFCSAANLLLHTSR